MPTPNHKRTNPISLSLIHIRTGTGTDAKRRPYAFKTTIFAQICVASLLPRFFPVQTLVINTFTSSYHS